MTQPSASIRVDLDTKDAKEEAKSFMDSILGSIVPTIDVANLASKAFQGLKNFIGETVGAAIEAEQAQLKFATALRAAGQDVDGTVERISALNNSLLQQTGIGDEALLGVQSLLTSYRVGAKDLDLATKATIGLSEATGKDLSAAAKDVSQLFQGKFTKDLKKVADEGLGAAAALEKLTGFMSIAGERTATFGGQWDLLGENLGEVKETIGATITGGEGLTGTLKLLNEAVVGLNVVISKAGDKGDSESWWSWTDVLKDGALQAANAILPINAFASTIKGLTEEFAKLGREATSAQSAMANAVPTIGADNQKYSLVGSPKGLDDVLDSSEHTFSPAAPEWRTKPKKKGGSRDPTSTQDLAGLGQGPDGFFEQARERADRELVEMERLNTERNNLEIDAFRAQLEIQEERERSELDAFNRGQALKARKLEEEQSHQLSMVEVLSAGAKAATGAIGDAFVSASVAAVLGGQNFGEVFKQQLGSMLVSLGASMVAAGLGAIALNALSFIPFFGTLFGPPGMGAAAGAVAVAGGLAMMGTGAALAGGSGASKPSGGGAGGGGGGRGGRGGSSPTTQQGGFDSGSVFGGGTPASVTFNINGGIFGGSKQQMSRDLRDVIGLGDRQILGGARR